MLFKMLGNHQAARESSYFKFVVAVERLFELDTGGRFALVGWGWVGDLGSWCQLPTGQAISGEFTSSVIAWTFSLPQGREEMSGVGFHTAAHPTRDLPSAGGYRL